MWFTWWFMDPGPRQWQIKLFGFGCYFFYLPNLQNNPLCTSMYHKKHYFKYWQTGHLNRISDTYQGGSKYELILFKFGGNYIGNECEHFWECLVGLRTYCYFSKISEPTIYILWFEKQASYIDPLLNKHGTTKKWA